MDDRSCIDAILGSDGLLQRSLPDFKTRLPQVQMAEAVHSAIHQHKHLLIEAGTGIGKTFAYLVPALLSNKKIIISTGTKNLQEQLFNKDLPLLTRILKKPVQVTLLKGRSNYLCRHRIQLYNDDPAFLSREIISQLYRIKLWANQTRYGDIAEIKSLTEDDPVWPYVTSTKDNCLNADCEYFNNCFVLKARQKALSAEIIVVNHHLFFADLLIKDSGFGELLPSADAVIFDEAHQLPEIAGHFFGISFSSRQLLELTRDIQMELLKTPHGQKALMRQCEQLSLAVQDMRLNLGMETGKKPWGHICRKPAVIRNIQTIKTALESLFEHLQPVAASGKNLENCVQRIQSLLQTFLQLTAEKQENYIHWFEVFAKSFIIHLTPLDIAEVFHHYLHEADKAWIFTSATLTANQEFGFYQQRMGLQNAQTLQFHSEFDYQRQARLYLPENLPEPNAAHYTQAIVKAAIPVINACAGRTFFLFTSHAAMRNAASLLESAIEYPLLLQGTMPKMELIHQFKQLKNAVLLGTYSFWEGVDVKGDTLSCVIIDRIPFASPQDPIMQARIQTLRKAGIEPFLHYQVPQAIIALKQGVGRLIRDEQDRGLLMLCDPRLRTKPYGQVFLQSLPPMPRLETWDAVKWFFTELDQAIE